MFERVRGRDVLVVLIVFFGVTIAVNVAMATFAIRSFSGEDAPKSYMIGLHFNETLAARAAQRARGWKADIAATRTSGGDAVIVVDLRDGNAKAVTGLALEGVLRLPATSREDKMLHFSEVGPGRYQTRIANVHPAYWDLIITTAQDVASAPDAQQGPFEARNRIWIR